MGNYYFNFMDRWNTNEMNRKGFFGLRDFYSYVKHVCKMIKQGGPSIDFEEELGKAILKNFDGQEKSLETFYKTME